MKQLLVLMIVAICITCSAKGQVNMGKPSIDSLIGALPKLSEDTNKVKVYAKIAWYYVNIDAKETQVYIQKTRNLAYKLGWKKGLSEILVTTADKLSGKGNTAQGIEYAFEAHKLYIEAKDTAKEIEALLLIADFFGWENKLDKKIEYLEIALHKALVYGNNEYISEAYYDKCAYFQTVENFDTAMVYIIKSIEYARKSLRTSFLPTCLTKAGIICTLQKKYQDALKYFNNALAEIDQQNHPTSKVFTLINIGNCYLMSRDPENALKYYYQCLAEAILFENFFYIGVSYSNIGEIYMGIANDSFGNVAASNLIPYNRKALIQKSIDCFDSSIKAYKNPRTGSNYYLPTTYLMMADALEQQGNYKKGSAVLRAYIAFKDSSYAADNSAKMTQLESQRELELKDKQIIIDRLEVEKKNTESKFYIVGICLSLLAAALALFAYRQKSKDNNTINKLVNEQEQTIAERTKQLAYANAKLVELVRYNAHNMREPLARVMGAMIIQDYMSSEEFYAEVWPQMQKAVADLDKTIKEVINLADATVDMYG